MAAITLHMYFQMITAAIVFFFSFLDRLGFPMSPLQCKGSVQYMHMKKLTK